MSSDPEDGRSISKPVGIKDIARALGVSTGTVDRALHAKPGVNPQTRARVLSMAESLGYRPNLAARFLQSRRQLRIAVHLPREIALFWDTLREGIREAAVPFAPALQVDFRSYPTLGKGDVPLFEEALREGVDGLIVAPGRPAALDGCFRKAAHKGLPVICVVTDAPDTPRLASVSADPYTVGAVAGELLARFQPGGGTTAFFTGWLSTQDHADKLRGFEASLLATGGAVRLGPVVEAHDDAREAYRRARAVLRARPDLTSIYVSTVNSLPVVRAAAEEGRLPGLILMTTDLFPELVEHIRSGAVAATVYQRPLSQGRLAFRALYQYLLDGTRPSPRINVVPHLVMRSNLELLLARLRVDPQAAPAERKPSRRNHVHGRSARAATAQPRHPDGPRRRL